MNQQIIIQPSNDTTVIDINLDVVQSVISTPNNPPSADAGVDTSITLPTNSTTLSGQASDTDGIISSYLWTQVSGPSQATFSGATSPTATVSNLVAGTYVFRLSVADDDGSIAFDDKTVVVNPAPVIISPYTLLWQERFDTDARIKEEKANDNQIANGSWSTFNGGSFYSVPDNVSSGTRSELQYDNSDTPQEGAIEWDAYYEVIVPDGCHSLQFHPITSGGSASPGLWHTGGKFSLVNWKNGTNVYHSTGFTIPSKRWLKFRLEFKFGSSGYLRLWIDGTQYINKTGIQVGDGSGQYLKVGFNGWTSSARNSRIYYDNVKVYKKA